MIGRRRAARARAPSRCRWRARSPRPSSPRDEAEVDDHVREHAAGAAAPRRRGDAVALLGPLGVRAVCRWVLADSCAGDVAPTASRIASREGPSGRSSVRMTQRPGRPGSPARRPRRLLAFLPLRGVACRRPGRPCPPRSFRHPSVSAWRGSALNGVSSRSQPDDVQLTTISAARRSTARRRAVGQRDRGRSGVRFQTATSAAPAARSAYTAARAAPPAPSTSARAPGRRLAAAPRAARRVGVVGVDGAVPLERERVRGADRARGRRSPRRRARARPPCAGSSR